MLAQGLYFVIMLKRSQSNIIRRLLLVVAFSLLLQACGHSGPLYLPQPHTKTPQTHKG